MLGLLHEKLFIFWTPTPTYMTPSKDCSAFNGFTKKSIDVHLDTKFSVDISDYVLSLLCHTKHLLRGLHITGYLSLNSLALF